MSKRGKIILGTTLSLALLLVLSGVLAVLLFPAERVRTLTETNLSRTLNVPVRISRLGISFRGVPSIRAAEITIGPARAGEPPFASVKAVKVRVALLPLLKRKVDIASLSVDSPVLNLLTRADGTTNLPALSDTTQEKKEESKLPLLISLRSFRISDGVVTLIDEKSGSRTELSDISEHLSLKISRDMKDLASTGTLTVGSVALSAKGKRSPLSGVKIRFTHDLSGDAAAGNFTLSKGELRVNDLPIALTGAMKNGKDLTVHAETGTLTADALIDAVPDSLLPNKRDIKAAGDVSFVLDGKIGLGGVKPDIRYTGTLSIRGMSVAVKGLPKKIDHLQSMVGITESALTFTDTEVRIGKSRATLAGTISRYLEKPELAIRTAGTVNLDDVTSALPLFKENAPTGSVGFNLAVSGTPEPDVTALKPSGTITLTKLTMSLPKSLKHPATLAGTVKIAPEVISIPSLALTTGKSGMTITGSLSNYLNLLPGRKGGPSLLKGRVSSRLLDLNDMLVIPKNSPVLKPWDLDEPLRNLPVPPALQATLGAKLNTVIFGRLKADSAEGTVTLDKGVLTLSGLKIAAYKGTITGKTTVNFSDSNRVVYSGGVDASKLNAQTFISSFFNTGDHFRGLFSAALTFTGSGLDSLSFARNLKANGSLTFENGQVVNWPVLKKLGEELQFLRFDTVDVERVHGAVEVRDAKVITPDLLAKTEYGDIAVSGTTGFNTAVDYHIAFDMNDTAVSLAAKTRLGNLANLVASSKRPELKITAKGTLKSPSFKVDSSGIERNVKDRAKEEAVKLIAKPDSTIDKGKKLLKKLFK